jgi:protein-disulfide isomerase
MPTIRVSFLVLPVLSLVVACGPSSAQSQKDPATLQKEIEALKAEQEDTRRSLEEVREFLRAATGGRFGAPSLINREFDVASEPAFGDRSAPVTIVEVSDYHCPFCRRHVQQTQPQIYADYVKTGKARHVFVHYPIAQLHPEAHRSHEAASCAGDQGRFWEFHTKLFETPVRTADELTNVAGTLGLDAAAFRACLESGKYTQAVQASVKRVQELNISGTPMFLIGRTGPDGTSVTVQKTIEGAQPYQAFKAAIDEVLNGAATGGGS